MPYIHVNTSKDLGGKGKEKLKTKLGELISLLPGKSEDVLMVHISDGQDMYFKGEKRDVAYLDIKLFRESDMESKSKFTSEVFRLFEREFGIDGGNLFLSISEYNTWGFLGSLMK